MTTSCSNTHKCALFAVETINNQGKHTRLIISHSNTYCWIYIHTHWHAHMYVYVLHNLRICAISRLCCRIPRLCTTAARSQDYTIHLRYFEIAQSLLPWCACAETISWLQGVTKKWWLCVVLIHCVTSCKIGNQHFVPYSEVSLTSSIFSLGMMRNQAVEHKRATFFQSFPWLYAGREG